MFCLYATVLCHRFQRDLFCLRSGFSLVNVYGQSWWRVNAVAFSARAQFSAVGFTCRDLVLQKPVLKYPGIVRVPSLVRVLSSDKAPHYLLRDRDCMEKKDRSALSELGGRVIGGRRLKAALSGGDWSSREIAVAVPVAFFFRRGVGGGCPFFNGKIPNF